MQIIGVVLVILMLLYSYVVVFLPCILGIIISVIVLSLIRKKIDGKSQKFNRTVNIIVIVVCGCIFVTLTPLWYNYIRAKPDDTYVKMKDINDNQSLIGLSKEQVVELLGDPYGNKDADSYCYSAGKLTNYITGGTNDFYHLKISFDDNGKVKSSSIELVV